MQGSRDMLKGKSIFTVIARNITELLQYIYHNIVPG